MIRHLSRGLFAVVLLLVSGLHGAWAVDLFGTGGGVFGPAQSGDADARGYYQGTGSRSPYQPTGDPSSAYPLGGYPYPMMGGDTLADQPGPPSAPAPTLPPLPPEGQSAFEQFVSGKIEITKAQLDVIVSDPAIVFTNFLAGVPNGTVAVPVGIVMPPGAAAPAKPPESAEQKAAAPSSDNVAPAATAGYLVGPRDRIADAFRLLGIASPYSISMDLKHFGLDLFEQGRSGFLTTANLPVGPDYVLGPEDEVKIRVWGKVEGAWIRRIERDGTVRLPKVGVVSLGGLSFAQAKETLHKEYSRVFTGFEMNVTLGALRTMTVYVVGNARMPGAYTVSSLSTLVHAMMQAGGPSKAGSMRDIQIRRDGMTVSHFDMYDLLRHGDKSGDPRLLPEDVIFIPPVGPVAAIAGSVSRPGLYELKGERTVSQLIELAGGLNALAFRGRLQIERIVESNRQIVFESDLAEWKEREVDLRSGDILKVFQIVKDQRTVRVTGAVLREGDYGFTPGMTVKDLVGLSGGAKYYAYLKEAELARLYLSEQGPRVEKVNLDLENAMAGDARSNLPLQENDHLFVRTIPEWGTYTQVSVLGEVRFPGTYTARKGERLSSLIERAGGYTSSAYVRGAVFTRVSVRETQQRMLDESIARLERDLMAQSAASAATAASGEELGAKELEVRRVQALVEKLRTFKARGRMVLEVSSPEKMKNTMNDIELENGDVLYVPQNPRCVHALGAVFNQATFVFDKSKGVEDYITMAGGFMDSGDKERVYILKSNGSAVRPDSGRFFLLPGSSFSSADGKPILESGDTIVVPEKIDRIAWLRNTKDVFQILFQATMAAGVVIAAL